METTQNYFLVALKLLGALGLLIYGMKMMSEALQKIAGPQLLGDLRRAVVVGHDGDDGIVCLGRTADAGTGHQYHHGSEHRNDADGVDHVAGL